MTIGAHLLAFVFDVGVHSYEAVRLAKGARPINVRLTLSPIRQSDGEVIGQTIAARDIGDRLRLDRALRTTEARRLTRSSSSTPTGSSRPNVHC